MEITTRTIERAEIRNLCDYPLYFKRLTENGDCKIEPPGQFPDYLLYEEVKAQVRAGNKMFIGIDGRGGHARIAIMDDGIRRELFNIGENEVTELLTLEAVKKLLKITDPGKFTERLQELVVTSAERGMIGKLAKEAGIDNMQVWKGKLIDEISMLDVKKNAKESYSYAARAFG